LQHYLDNIRLNDYRRYGYFSNDEPSADLTNIEVPMGVMYGGADTLCPRSSNQRFIDQIPTVEAEVELVDANHFYFTEVNDAEFKTEIDKLLTHSSEEIQDEVC